MQTDLEYWAARERLGEFLKRVTYKPGWKFLVSAPSFESSWRTVIDMFITRRVHDLSNPESLELTVMLTMHFQCEVRIVLEAPSSELERFLQDCITRFELHERDEWYKVDGKCFQDPHPERS